MISGYHSSLQEYLLLSYCLGLVPSLIYEDTFAQVQTQSTSLSAFPRQEVNAGIHNGIQVNVSAHTQSKADYKGLLDNSSDIQKVTYSSNGKKLNATLWLGGEIRGIPSKFGASICSIRNTSRCRQ